VHAAAAVAGARGSGAAARGVEAARAEAVSPVLAVSARPGGGAVVWRAGRRCGGAVWRRRVAGSRGRRREMELRQRALWSCDSGVPRLGRPQCWCRLEATNACIGVPALRAKALARFILVKWRRRLRASLSLLRASFWSCNPPARGLWVKTRFSSWTSDGGACGRRDLLGGVVSRDTVRRLGRPAARDFLRPVVTNLSEGVQRRGLPTSR